MLELVIAVVGIGVSMVAVVIGMMFWVRSESNALRNEAKEDRKEFLQISRNLELTVMSIKDEMKDFHRQLIEIKRGENMLLLLAFIIGAFIDGDE